MESRGVILQILELFLLFRPQSHLPRLNGVGLVVSTKVFLTRVLVGFPPLRKGAVADLKLCEQQHPGLSVGQKWHPGEFTGTLSQVTSLICSAKQCSKTVCVHFHISQHLKLIRLLKIFVRKSVPNQRKREPLQFSVLSSILFFSAIQNRARCCSLIFLIKAEFETNKFGVLRVCFHVLSSAFEIVNTTTLTLVVTRYRGQRIQSGYRIF